MSRPERTPVIEGFARTSPPEWSARGGVLAFAPGSVGNVGSGFDVLGMALPSVGDWVGARAIDGGEVVLAAIHAPEGATIPADTGRNSASVAARALLDALGIRDRGIELTLWKGLPLSAGMGGSAASAVASVVAVAGLLRRSPAPDVLLQAALAGEAAAAGAPHPDNAAASLLGGVVLTRETGEGLDLVPIPVPEGLTVVLVHPHVELPTAQGRSVIPREVPLSTAVAQLANVAGLVNALATGDLDRLGPCLEDHLAEPHRAKLIPAFREVKGAGEGAGALGVGISGSGPSLFALARDGSSALQAGRAMVAAFRDGAGVGADLLVGSARAPGAHLVEKGT